MGCMVCGSGITHFDSEDGSLCKRCFWDRQKAPSSPGPVLSDLLSCRNEFEKWMVAEKWDIASGGLSRDIEEEETYEYTGTQVMWEAWKAAWDKKAR